MVETAKVVALLLFISDLSLSDITLESSTRRRRLVVALALLVLVLSLFALTRQHGLLRVLDDGDGGHGQVCEVTQLFPRVGLYEVMVGVASRGVNFADLPMTAVPVVKDAQQAVLTNAGEKKQGENK